MLNGLLASLPEWSIKEQILAYRDAPQLRVEAKDCKLLVEPTLWHSRIKVAEAFDSFLRSRGVTGDVRIPRGSTTESVQKKLVLKKGMKRVNATILRWRRQWRETGSRPSAEKTFSKKMCYGSVPPSEASARARWRGDGGARLGARKFVRVVRFHALLD